mgnify:CR=1 FL=1
MIEKQFFVPGIPKAQPRVKACLRGAHAGVYTPKTADDWKRAVMIAAKDLSGAVLDEPLCLRVIFYLPAPKRRHSPSPFVAVKPDLDNLLKALMDALTAIGVWIDDSRVVEIFASKKYAIEDRCGAEVFIGTREGGVYEN